MAGRKRSHGKQNGETNDQGTTKKKKQSATQAKNGDSRASSSEAPTAEATSSASSSITVHRRELSKAQRLPRTMPYAAAKGLASEEGCFPPTIYTNVEYSNGILISYDGKRLLLPQDYMVAAYGHPKYPYSPLLPQPEVWSYKYSAMEAARHGFPLSVYRLLGTITRTVRARGPPSSRWKNATKHKPSAAHTVASVKRTKFPKPHLNKQALADLPPDHSKTERATRISQIQALWDRHWSSDGIPKIWDPTYGHLHSHMIHDDHHVPLQDLVTWKFDQTDEVVDLYQGLRTVPVDTRSILNSLAELQSPVGLYDIPLVMTYPVLKQTSNGTYKLRIGVYAHRLLPEVLVEQDLLKVMTALDRDSYHTTEPIHVAPTPTQPVFASAPLPKLVFHEEDETKETAGSKVDLTLCDSTRETPDVLSAFTIPGLLKMWENTGNDISEWPQLERTLQHRLTMPLLCHQQHALCWMRQMESLGGFGINSIIWEEREWHDGGKYYYSPALGQLRLDRPATMHGGILADEMGLGKTIMILALIVTTMNELRRSGSHCTLIVVPPALMWQWKAEISKAAPYLFVRLYNSPHMSPQQQQELEKADIVLTTYQVLDNVKTSKWLREMSWGRIVLDEMQEIRSSSTAIARNCDKLKARRRWMLSGTPLFDGIEDLRGELNFLSLEPYAAKSEDGFFDFSITNHWKLHSKHGLDTLKVLGLLLLRRSKAMTICKTGAPLMGLKPMTVEFTPVPQSPYERAIYCFLEYIVSTQLKDEDVAGGVSRLCLRLLRELCISPMLLAGGLGVTSELVKLDNLVKLYNRRAFFEQFPAGLDRDEELERRPDNDLYRGLSQIRTGLTRNRTLSCAEAIRYLSQVQAKVQTMDDFVSDLTLGAGGGMAKRNRATDSLEERRKECRKKLVVAEKEIKAARATKARAYWHLALERVTMGEVSLPSTVGRSIAALWRWRAAVQGSAFPKPVSQASQRVPLRPASIHSTVDRPIGGLLRCRTAEGGDLPVNVDTGQKLPCLLTRGWRPSSRFKRALPNNHPDYGWAHPVALALHNIPPTVKAQELHRAIASVVESTAHKVVTKSNGCAIIQFSDAEKATMLRQHAKKGVEVTTVDRVPFVENALRESNAAYEQARNENDVYSTIDSRKRVREAQRKMESASRGLLIVLDGDSPHIRLVRAKGPPRSQHPQMAVILYRTLEADIVDSNQRLAEHITVAKEQAKLLKNLGRAIEVPDDVKQMSAFESLEAMSFKEYEKTSCVICVGPLGSSDAYSVDDSIPGMVGLTPCGHLFCASCISDYIASQLASNRQAKCPTCRKELEKTELVVVDPSLCTNAEQMEAKQRSGAKNLIRKAAKMLDESNGQLDQDMWLQLFLAIDPPTHVSQRGDPRVSAIPREVISFFRAATCFEQVHNNATAVPTVEPAHGLSSKMQALLRDLPRKERSVVFTSSRAAVQHLMALLSYHRIGNRAVFSGQSPAQAERAVFDWKGSLVGCDLEEKTDETATSPLDNPLVLIVQSGAAASGLTLTAACKMFFLEPFVRQEEEQQAFARCHRYGQVHAVHAKVYFSPVTVESRLLEWRKQVAAASRADTKVVYNDIMDVDCCESDIDGSADDDDVDSEQGDADQTLFLLGLK